MTRQQPRPPFDLSKYRHLGDPLAAHELTCADHRRQADHVALAEHARTTVATFPPLTNDQINRLAATLHRIERQPRSNLMRWRLRLYCGHTIERTAHREHTTIYDAFAGECVCPTCGLHPSIIIAATPLGLAAPEQPPTTDTDALERELARLEKRISALDRERQRLTDRATALRQQVETIRPCTEQEHEFSVRSAATVLHRRDCRHFTSYRTTSPGRELLRLNTSQADEWLRANPDRRPCQTCQPAPCG
ncbi:hypothetical protein AB5J62_40850 [Amycolatopsis sp. cg5]|uniref:hypothetical protein n=1 Tax=Amycolatopsis sp. cg5 TaxID=3238802 RepID=UPI003525150F